MNQMNSSAESSAVQGHSSQFALLGQRRFAPFFWVQFLGAGNDNVFKFAFTVLVTYQLQVAWLPASSNRVLPAAREISVLRARASAMAIEAAATVLALVLL